jgi:hypothetical protein
MFVITKQLLTDMLPTVLLLLLLQAHIAPGTPIAPASMSSAATPSHKTPRTQTSTLIGCWRSLEAQ